MTHVPQYINTTTCRLSRLVKLEPIIQIRMILSRFFFLVGLAEKKPMLQKFDRLFDYLFNYFCSLLGGNLFSFSFFLRVHSSLSRHSPSLSPLSRPSCSLSPHFPSASLFPSSLFDSLHPPPLFVLSASPFFLFFIAVAAYGWVGPI